MIRLLTAVFLFASFHAVAEVTLTDINNNEVADAEVVMDNFNALKDAIEVLQPPEGDLFFRYTDPANASYVEGLGIHKREVEDVYLEIDGAQWGPIKQVGSEPWTYVQKGIVFHRNILTRQYPPVAPPESCPQDTTVAIPTEIFESYHNQYGSIVQTTSWDFGEYGGPHPSAMADNPSGSYICIVQNEGVLEVVIVLNFGALVGGGRYQCAVAVVEQLVVYGSDSSSTSLPLTQLGDTVATVRTSYGTAPALISADIPAACNEPRSKSTATGGNISADLFGFDIEWPTPAED